jgi:hypothetical protein
LNIGDKVRIIGIPPDLPEGQLETRSLFEECVGRVFPIFDFNEELIELQVGEVWDQLPCMQSIWIEPEFVEMVEPVS